MDAAGTDDGLSPSMRLVAAQLRFYTAAFRGAALDALGAAQVHAPAAQALRSIADASELDAEEALGALRAWPAPPADADGFHARMHERILEDLLALKENTTEALVAIGMRAPNDASRRTFIALAGRQRRHADTLRDLLATHRAGRVHGQDPPLGRRFSVGAHDGRVVEGSFAQSVAQALADLREDGQDPKRIVLSAVALRHARDEGALDAQSSTLHGLPVDVEFGWRGECFAVETADRRPLSALVAEATSSARE